jgi:hypothetical protein
LSQWASESAMESRMWSVQKTPLLIWWTKCDSENESHNLMKKLKILFLVGILSAVGYLCISSQGILLPQRSKHIPEADKEILDLFLRDLIFNNHFGYTLFGEKPISIAGYFSEEPLWNLIFFHGRPKFTFESAWAKWENCAKKLPTKNYLLIRESNPRYPGLITVTLVNKRAFLATFKEHHQLFQKILGKGITGEKLLERLLSKQTGLFELLRYDEALYGILLGYGKANALAYKRRCELSPWIADGELLLERPFSLYFPAPSSGFISIHEEHAFLEGCLAPFNDHTRLNLIAPPYFLALTEDEETSLLRLKYQKTRRELSELYSKGNFLDLTFKQYASSAG